MDPELLRIRISFSISYRVWMVLKGLPRNVNICKSRLDSGEKPVETIHTSTWMVSAGF